MSSDESFWKWLGGLILAGLMFLLGLGVTALINEATNVPKPSYPVVTYDVPRYTRTHQP